MNFREYLQKTAKDIDKELDNFFLEWNKDVGNISTRLLPLANALADSCRGGKRIRGALVRLGYEMSLSKDDRILKVAVAYEIFQAAILAHDDIIDKSPLRRGKPSLYARLGGEHTGESMAICLGDIGFFLAFRLIAESGFADKEKNRALSIFSKTMFETGIGELLDVELGTGREGGAKDDIVTVYKFKTAYYTITAPLLLGAVLGGVGESHFEAIRIFGQNLGIAFQIQDDINDIFSDKKKLGKEIGDDIREGKQTLLYVYAKEHASKQQKVLLEKYYGNSKIGTREIEVVKEILVGTGAFKYVRAEAERYTRMAKECIPSITKDDGYREMLGEMGEYFIGREVLNSKFKAPNFK